MRVCALACFNVKIHTVDTGKASVEKLEERFCTRNWNRNGDRRHLRSPLTADGVSSGR